MLILHNDHVMVTDRLHPEERVGVGGGWGVGGGGTEITRAEIS